MEYKYSDITQSIIAAALEMHKIIGNGFQEVIYQRALDLELENYRLLKRICNYRLTKRSRQFILNYWNLRIKTNGRTSWDGKLSGWKWLNY